MKWLFLTYMAVSVVGCYIPEAAGKERAGPQIGALLAAVLYIGACGIDSVRK